VRPHLVPTDIAAAALGVKRGTVRKLIQRGRLTRYGTAKRALVDLTECEALRLGIEAA
jgi:excisionase family DNA binding protein